MCECVSLGHGWPSKFHTCNHTLTDTKVVLVLGKGLIGIKWMSKRQLDKLTSNNKRERYTHMLRCTYEHIPNCYNYNQVLYAFNRSAGVLVGR